MTKINKIAIILMLLVFCALCSFGLVGCRSKDPNEFNYWLGTYEQFDDVFIHLIVFRSTLFYALAQLTPDGVDYYMDDGTLVHLDVSWGEDNYKLLQQGLQNIGRKVTLNITTVKMAKVKWQYQVKKWEEDRVDEDGNTYTARMFHFMLPKEEKVETHHFFNEPARGEYDLLVYNHEYKFTLEDGQNCRVTFVAQYRRKK